MSIPMSDPEEQLLPNLDKPIELVGDLSVRALNVCRALHIETPRDLLRYVWQNGEDCFVRDNCGRVTRVTLMIVYCQYFEVVVNQALKKPEGSCPESNV